MSCRLRFGIKKKHLAKVYVVLLIIIFNLLFPIVINAQLIINEFSPNSNPEWVEIYNLNQFDVDLTGWKLVDEKDNTEKLFGIVRSNSYFVFERGQGWLNNSGGDSVILKNNEDVIVDSVTYGHSGDIVGNAESDKSIGGIPDGKGEWYVNLLWTKGEKNYRESPSPTPSNSPSTTPLLKAIYRINSPKDNLGLPLTGVKIYVDDKYIHHEDAENLEFFNGNECYTEISCGIGIHIISLKKEGFSDWNETKDFQEGLVLEANPILVRNQIINTASPIPISSPITTPSNLSTPKAVNTPISSPSASPNSSLLNILGIKITPNPSPISWDNKESKHVKDNISVIIGVILIVVGIGFVGYSVLTVFRDIKKSYTNKNE